MKQKVRAKVLSQKKLTDGIYDMWLSTELAGRAGAGQFIGIYTGHEAHLLPRPVSICEAGKDGEALRVVYRIAGRGTEIFSGWKPGDEVQILGILGNGYSIEAACGKQTVLMGGGIGIPPMLQLAKELCMAGTKPVVVLGYRNNQLFLKEEFEPYAGVYVATEDGSAGTKGNVLTVMEKEQLKADVIMACGPMPMLRAIKNYAGEKHIEAYISLEERMACGVGACLGCVCKTVHKDGHSHVNNARICTDGPVFDAREVEI